MNIFTGIENFLRIVNDNWTTIIIIVGLSITLFNKIKDYLAKTTEEKILIAKEQISEIVLKLVTEAEMDYIEWNKAGSVKRAQVIEKLFEMYPILARATDQKALIDWIDTAIDEALITMKDVFEVNFDAVKAVSESKTDTANM